MSSLDRWLWLFKLVGVVFSTGTAILAFWTQVLALWIKKRKKKRNSLQRTTR